MNGSTQVESCEKCSLKRIENDSPLPYASRRVAEPPLNSSGTLVRCEKRGEPRLAVRPLTDLETRSGQTGVNVTVSRGNGPRWWPADPEVHLTAFVTRDSTCPVGQAFGQASPTQLAVSSQSRWYLKEPS